jgi:Rrf2 family transcriptional regulator, cysteine metabolism repressor
MPLLSRKADYALLILSHLNDHPDGANAREIAERFDLSRAFVANILKELGHHEFVHSERGVKGGYFLVEAAKQTSLATLLEALGEGFRLTFCNEGSDHEACSLESVCPVKNPLALIHKRMLNALKSVTLAELFTSPTTSAAPAALELLNLLPIRQQPVTTSPPTASVV